MPLLTTFLAGVAGEAASFALHQDLTNVAYTTAGALALMSAAKALPSFSVRNWELPQVRSIGSFPKILSPDAIRLLDTINANLTNSPLPGRSDVLDALDDLRRKANRFGRKANSIAPAVRNIHASYRPSLSVAEGMADRESVQKLRAIPRLLKVSCSIAEPAVLAALLHMRNAIKIPLEISYKEINGVAQAVIGSEMVDAGSPFDFMIAPNAPFLSCSARGGREELRDLYELLLPVHREHQHLLVSKRSKSGDFAGIEKIDFLGDSSCEEQYRGLRDNLNAKPVEWGLSDLPKLRGGLDGNEAVILYDPAASRIVKAGLAVSVKSQGYDLWVSLFGLRETIQRLQIARPFVNAFVASWVHCRVNRSDAWDLVAADDEIMEAFRKALLVSPC